MAERPFPLSFSGMEERHPRLAHNQETTGSNPVARTELSLRKEIYGDQIPEVLVFLPMAAQPNQRQEDPSCCVRWPH